MSMDTKVLTYLQQQILDTLEIEGRWMHSEEIAIKLRRKTNGVTTSLSRIPKDLIVVDEPVGYPRQYCARSVMER